MNSSSSSIEAHKKQTSNRIKRIFDSLQTTTVYLWHRKSPLRWKAEYLFLFSFPSFFFRIFVNEHYENQTRRGEIVIL